MEIERWGIEYVVDYCCNCELLVEQDMDADYVEDSVSVIWFCERCGTENEYWRYVGD